MNATDPTPVQPLTGAQGLIFLWGVGGVLALLVQAITRLAHYALEALTEGSMSGPQIALLLAWVLIAAYSEGYRAFQLRFCPRVVARALHLATNAKPLHVALAPAFCMALFYARRRTLITAWVTLSVIVALITLLRITPQPWRGIVDGGVVVGLSWGAVSLVTQAIAVLRGQAPPASPELPP